MPEHYTAADYDDDSRYRRDLYAAAAWDASRHEPDPDPDLPDCRDVGCQGCARCTRGRR